MASRKSNQRFMAWSIVAIVLFCNQRISMVEYPSNKQGIGSPQKGVICSGTNAGTTGKRLRSCP
jgi:hypothetical protein